MITGDIERRDSAISLLSLIGDTFWVDSEKEIDIATPLQVQVQHFWHSVD